MKAKHRDGVRVLAALTDLPDKPVVTKSDMVIQVPSRFRDIGLLSIGSKTFVFGFFAMILPDGTYGIMSVNALMELGPCQVDREEINGEEYMNFIFKKGDVLFRTKKLVCRTSVIFKTFDEFFFKGKIPWYGSYDDISSIFATAKKHSKTRAEVTPEVVEFLTAYISRDKNNRKFFIRETAKSYQEFQTNLRFVPMQSVFWSAPGTVNKLAGAYFENGIVSALVNPSERVEKIESILRA